MTGMCAPVYSVSWGTRVGSTRPFVNGSDALWTFILNPHDVAEGYT
jgi:hypothetical protein